MVVCIYIVVEGWLFSLCLLFWFVLLFVLLDCLDGIWWGSCLYWFFLLLFGWRFWIMKYVRECVVFVGGDCYGFLLLGYNCLFLVFWCWRLVLVVCFLDVVFWRVCFVGILGFGVCCWVWLFLCWLFLGNGLFVCVLLMNCLLLVFVWLLCGFGFWCLLFCGIFFWMLVWFLWVFFLCWWFLLIVCLFGLLWLGNVCGWCFWVVDGFFFSLCWWCVLLSVLGSFVFWCCIWWWLWSCWLGFVICGGWWLVLGWGLEWCFCGCLLFCVLLGWIWVLLLGVGIVIFFLFWICWCCRVGCCLGGIEVVLDGFVWLIVYVGWLNLKYWLLVFFLDGCVGFWYDYCLICCMK